MFTEHWEDIVPRTEQWAEVIYACNTSSCFWKAFHLFLVLLILRYVAQDIRKFPREGSFKNYSEESRLKLAGSGICGRTFLLQTHIWQDLRKRWWSNQFIHTNRLKYFINPVAMLATSLSTFPSGKTLAMLHDKQEVSEWWA